jgi:hypothetical protein
MVIETSDRSDWTKRELIDWLDQFEDGARVQIVTWAVTRKPGIMVTIATATKE